MKRIRDKIRFWDETNKSLSYPANFPLFLLLSLASLQKNSRILFKKFRLKHFSLRAKAYHVSKRKKEKERATIHKYESRFSRNAVSSRIDVARFDSEKKKKRKESQVFPEENTSAKVFDVNARATPHPHKVLKEQSRIGVSSFSFQALPFKAHPTASW